MEQAGRQAEQDARVVQNLAQKFGKDAAWMLSAVDALSNATLARRALIGIQSEDVQLALLDELVRVQSSLPADAGGGAGGAAAATGAAAGPGPGSAAIAGLKKVLFPSRLYIFTFTLLNGSHVATKLVSHAKALGFRGKVRHMSESRSDFTLLGSAEEESNTQTLLSFARWLRDQVPVRMHTAEAAAVGTSAAEEEGPLALVTSDLYKPFTSDQALLGLYNSGQLSVSSTPAVQLALEQAARVEEQEERLNKFSSGRSSASSAQE